MEAKDARAQPISASYERFSKRSFLFFYILPLCHGCVDSQPCTPVSLRWCRVLCHQRESILLLMKQKMKRSLQLLITDCREPFIIVSRRDAGTPSLISAAWLWHYTVFHGIYHGILWYIMLYIMVYIMVHHGICHGIYHDTLQMWESKMESCECKFCFLVFPLAQFFKLPPLLIMHQKRVGALKYAVSFTGRHDKY